jgi:hypothetical protein
MQSTNIRWIKAALRDQAFLGTTRVSCPIGPVVAIRKRKGRLRVMIRGWGTGTAWRACALRAQAIGSSSREHDPSSWGSSRLVPFGRPGSSLLGETVCERSALVAR